MATAVNVGWIGGRVASSAIGVIGGVGGGVSRGTVARGIVVGTAAGVPQADIEREKKKKEKKRKRKFRFTFPLSRCILDCGGKRSNDVRWRPIQPQFIYQPRTKPGRI
jgi:hypothetical protein